MCLRACTCVCVCVCVCFIATVAVVRDMQPSLYFTIYRLWEHWLDINLEKSKTLTVDKEPKRKGRLEEKYLKSVDKPLLFSSDPDDTIRVLAMIMRFLFYDHFFYF